ncbi:hypothetical protein PF005_g28770 [Phytophthora fragariae]|uniref:Uncharacterized protein n=1 Tax=Phytophthora fragariae TaxID=53985 RepID=A0A6A3WX27_9STRA|nr:hypothetical protein PF009_g26807 [Phytophthora fragariae]KAE8970225.1 hypothetical protein PF011_g26500 [Phytophthora fragariae]KAE9068423.1 hypothetical protein PF010_g27073 [Phytophthora fragariae]KAE9079225.1 hypothetical protein PF006_g27565 [Phytophthora fragariae]KAE9079944.1 hypothetical protein PF007_g23240 [Phytophthora fragariae]
MAVVTKNLKMTTKTVKTEMKVIVKAESKVNVKVKRETKVKAETKVNVKAETKVKPETKVKVVKRETKPKAASKKEPKKKLLLLLEPPLSDLQPLGTYHGDASREGCNGGRYRQDRRSFPSNPKAAKAFDGYEAQKKKALAVAREKVVATAVSALEKAKTISIPNAHAAALASAENAYKAFAQNLVKQQMEIVKTSLPTDAKLRSLPTTFPQCAEKRIELARESIGVTIAKLDLLRTQIISAAIQTHGQAVTIAEADQQQALVKAEQAHQTVLAGATDKYLTQLTSAVAKLRKSVMP